MTLKIGPGVKIVDKDSLEAQRGDIFELIQRYFDQSEDKSSNPAKVMIDLIKNIENPDHLLATHEANGKMDGFLVGKVVQPGPVGRILMAFLGNGLDNKTIITEALELFDSWAKERKCIASDLYTHRHPKSYRSLKGLGWRHNYTVYRRDYAEEKP